jgi:flagellar assembly protein FliH
MKSLFKPMFEAGKANKDVSGMVPLNPPDVSSGSSGPHAGVATTKSGFQPLLDSGFFSQPPTEETPEQAEPVEEPPLEVKDAEPERTPPEPPAAQREAEDALKGAKAESEKILKEAQEKAAHIEREAYESGYKQGEKTGIEIGEKRFESVIKALEKALEEFKGIAASSLGEMESEIVRLSLAVARKIVHAEVLQNPDVIIQNLQHVLRRVTDKDSVVIRLHPSDADRAKSAQSELLDGMPDIRDLAFQPDPAVPRGGAVVETSFGDLDARLDEQFQRIEKSLIENLERQRSETSTDETS